MDKEILKQIILEQKKIFQKDMKIVERDIRGNFLKTNKIVVITGIRRCGKSTLLRQISRHHGEFHYFNFEDERLLEFTHKDFNILLQAFMELNSSKTLFFDEIQNIDGWEKFARRLFEEGYKLYITGSNAKLLSSEIATSLTGRNIKITLFPFSFIEYLKYNDFPVKKLYTTEEQAIISRHLEEYLLYGGFPEIAGSKDLEELNGIYQDIIIKDLIVRMKIKDVKDFRELAIYILSNVSKKISFNNLKNLLGFKSTSKVKNYFDYLSEAYLFFELFKYSYSIKKQIRSNRKAYAIDTGIMNALSFKFSENRGQYIENIVFLELTRKGEDIYYFEDDKECDFLIRQNNRVTRAIQVSAHLTDPETRRREMQGLKNAMKEFNLKEGFIITMSHEEKAGNIRIMPLWRFLLHGLN